MELNLKYIQIQINSKVFDLMSDIGLKLCV